MNGSMVYKWQSMSPFLNPPSAFPWMIMYSTFLLFLIYTSTFSWAISSIFMISKTNQDQIYTFFGYERYCNISSETGTTMFLPWELYSASHYQTTITLNCVCEQQCFISIYFMHSCFYYNVNVIWFYVLFGMIW